MARIALVTSRPGADVVADPDLPVLLEALRAAGAEAQGVAWDDPDVDWGGFDLAVIRSTWDYSWRAAEFLDWAERCGRATRLANPAHIVRWNVDKRYLGDLAAARIPTVPTRYLAPGEPADLPDGHEYVVKPTSGAGARLAARYTPDQHATAVRQLERMHADGFTAMVQPYVDAIDTTGERALVLYGGTLRHAIRKGPVLARGTAYDERKVPHPGVEPWTPTGPERTLAERALAAVPGASGLLYARVDLVDGADGEPCVMELELVEPHLFLDLHPGSVEPIAAAMLAAAR
ncbi:RimK family alpha-L-glutamate ligase [Streptomyces sp. NPDC088789]|uniref:ATP-grasp domain-containing protein n=1 Tax=Streptomyces sp. NPDC088789 TaxID=3365899 RepID=UPI0038142039